MLTFQYILISDQQKKKVQLKQVWYQYALLHCDTVFSYFRFAFEPKMFFHIWNWIKLPNNPRVIIWLDLIVFNSSSMLFVWSPDSKMVWNIKIGNEKPHWIHKAMIKYDITVRYQYAWSHFDTAFSYFRFASWIKNVFSYLKMN